LLEVDFRSNLTLQNVRLLIHFLNM